MASLTWVVSSCVLILAVITLRALLGKRIRLETRYILWGLVLLRLLLPFEIGQSAWSVASVMQRAASIAQQAEWTRLSENFTTLPYLDDTGYAGDGAGVTAGGKDPDGLSAERRPVLPAAGAAERSASTVHWQDALRRVWYGGMAITAALFLASNLLFYLRLCRRRVPLDIDCKLKVYSVENLSSSCLFLGSIYVSAETAEDRVKLRHVLAHELAHHRHMDGVWALLRCAAVVLHWYNPLVWWAAVLSRRDSELLADEGALKSLGEGERERYGVTLIKLSVRRPVSASLLCAATTMTGGKRALRERIVMIAKQPKAALWAVVVVGVAAALAVGTTLVGAADTPALQLAREDILGVSVYDVSKVETDGVWQMNGAEIDEFYSRLSQIRLFPNTDGFDGITPYYSLTVSVKDGGNLLICGYDGGGTMTDILYRGKVYRVTDREFQQYVRRVCAGETRTAAEPDAPGRWDGEQWDESDISVFGGAVGPRGFSMPIDLDHDGAQETVEVREVWMDERPVGVLVSVPDSELSFELNVAHAGWGSIFKYISPDDGKDYLLYYCPYFGTGSGAYWYELYDFTGLLRSNEVDFCIGPLGQLDMDGERMEAFADEINALLEHSTLLASTDGGSIQLGPASAEPYYETYAVVLSVFPYEGQEEHAGLTLAEQIEYYESAIWADFMKGTLPLFTEDVSQFLDYLSGHDLDWRALWEIDDGATLELIGALRDYVGANEPNDLEYETLLRRTRGLDGAYAGAYSEVLEALWQRGGARYLRIWSGLPEAEQDRAIPYHAHEAVNFAGLDAARAWMNESRALGFTEVPARAETNARPAPAAGPASSFTEIPQ